MFVGMDMDSLEKVNKSVTDEIYRVIDSHFEQAGITDVPVVFRWEGRVVLDEGLGLQTMKQYKKKTR
jgi:hypothetical protein